ncbi:GntR family transcriptional regulator [Roseobacter sinensis]|uniref:GntR family transcriptional regulator n=1 Tax=Roseobacter sinensis TaxID=2931391 RepID=A0ABT3BIP3_9RHOB|nr:GntR family transcriptional regulator [Roseobacter sp. WL0113]MCV3273446.1 GntR family transcriptional regulator [Roseobacter sp. WL0113]
MQSPSEKSEAVAERVAAILRDRIVKGELAPRDRIVERRLSAELHVSRTPVREALKLLEADGLIEITHHRGALVSEYRSEDAVRLFDVIAVLEGLAARRLAEQMSAATLQQLEDFHGQMLEHHRAGRSEQYFDLNTMIHDVIVGNCGNPVVADTHRRLIARARRGRFLAIMDPERLDQAVDEHQQLMRALRASDPSAASDIWETHLRHTGDTLAALLSRHEAENAQ